MRLLGLLYLVFLVQRDVGAVFANSDSEDASAQLTRRKRGWSFSASTSVTKRPIGWSFSSGSQQKPKRKSYPTQASYYMPMQHGYSQPSSLTVNFVKPTKSLTRELVKAAVVVGVVGAASSYVKPVKPVTKSPAQRAQEREMRRQQRLSRRSTTTTPVTPVEGNVTTPAVPLANSELIPVMVQDENKLLHIVYVRRDQIPPGGIPIAMQVPFPMAPAPAPQQPVPSSEGPQLPVPSMNSTSPITGAQFNQTVLQ